MYERLLYERLLYNRLQMLLSLNWLMYGLR